MAILPDVPELQAIAALADVDATKMAAAFNDPPSFFEHLNIVELAKIHDACQRLTALNSVMVAALDTYAAYAKGVLEGAAFTAQRPAEAAPKEN